MIAASKMVIRAMATCPTASRWLLTRYLRSGAPIPNRWKWLVEQLKRDLQPANSVQIVRLAGGLSLEVDVRTAIGRDLYYCGTFEPELKQFLSRRLKCGATVIDAGANLGEFTLLAARLVGPQGRVIALEASPVTAHNLSRNVERNGLANVKVVQAALTSADARQTFYLGRGRDSGSSSLSPPHDFTGETVDVDGVTLDTLVERENLRSVDYLKLDIEGAELEALQGAAVLLSSSPRPAVIFEWNPQVICRSGWRFEEAANLLHSYGYKVHRLSTGGSLADAEIAPSENCNLVALPARG